MTDFEEKDIVIPRPRDGVTNEDILFRLNQLYSRRLNDEKLIGDIATRVFKKLKADTGWEGWARDLHQEFRELTQAVRGAVVVKNACLNTVQKLKLDFAKQVRIEQRKINKLATIPKDFKVDD